ncbi:hypothetical protein [Kitasatospora sp. NPDC101183]|uniref:hypothetical protein n=1 Tax=Kitasatospora sp. NPDC101183 TaxID=3364100 RepID=UPI0038145B1C
MTDTTRPDPARAAAPERLKLALYSSRPAPADLGIGQVHFPEEHVVGVAPGTSAKVLRERCEASMVRHGYDRSPTMRTRLEEELRVVSTLGWPTYFL